MPFADCVASEGDHRRMAFGRMVAVLRAFEVSVRLPDGIVGRVAALQWCDSPLRRVSTGAARLRGALHVAEISNEFGHGTRQ